MQLSEYEQEWHGIHYIKYPAANRKRLVVTFASKSAGYDRVKQFWNEESWPDTEYLFFSENNNTTWYLQYDEILEHTLTGIDLRDVVFLGSSMGAFAALWYGAGLKVGTVLATACQTPPLAFPDDFTGNHTNLWSELQKRFVIYRPHLYIETTGATNDYAITRKLVSLYTTLGGRLILESRPELRTHQGLSLWNGAFTQSAIEFLNYWARLVR